MSRYIYFSAPGIDDYSHTICTVDVRGCLVWETITRAAREGVETTFRSKRFLSSALELCCFFITMSLNVMFLLFKPLGASLSETKSASVVRQTVHNYPSKNSISDSS